MVAIALLGGLLVLQRGSGVAVIPLLGSVLGHNDCYLLCSRSTVVGQRLRVTTQRSRLCWRCSTCPLKLLLPSRYRCLFGIQSTSYFSYGTEQPEVLRGLDLEIRCGERIGLIGVTGSGKSTTIDLLMGLLHLHQSGGSETSILPIRRDWQLGSGDCPCASEYLLV